MIVEKKERFVLARMESPGKFVYVRVVNDGFGSVFEEVPNIEDATPFRTDYAADIALRECDRKDLYDVHSLRIVYHLGGRSKKCEST